MPVIWSLVMAYGMHGPVCPQPLPEKHRVRLKSGLYTNHSVMTQVSDVNRTFLQRQRRHDGQSVWNLHPVGPVTPVCTVADALCHTSY